MGSIPPAPPVASRSPLRNAFALACAALLLSLLACSSISVSPTPSLTPTPVSTLSGFVTAAGQPVSGAHIYLLSTGDTGLGSSSTSLLAAASTGVSADAAGRGYLTSASDGSFALTGSYAACPASTQIYAVALGGSPGNAAGSNAAIAFGASLGVCGSLPSVTTIHLNELTTVAFASAFTPYIDGPFDVGAASNQSGALSDAAAAAATLVSPFTGTANTALATSVIPTATINTFADILASCAGTSSLSSTGCTALFAAAPEVQTSTAPTDTFTAAVDIARNRATKVATLFALKPGNPPYLPALATAPTDWTLAPQLSSAVSTAPGVIELGDSITTLQNVNGAIPASLGYGQLLADTLGNPFNNGVGIYSTDYSRSGDEAADNTYKAWIFGIPTASGNPTVTLMIGTNDLNHEDTPTATNTNHQQFYREALLADLSLWLTPPANKLFPYGNSACSGSGAWSFDGSFPGSQNGTGVYTTAIGQPFSCTYTTYGGAIYVWHLVDGTEGTATVAIDGKTCGTYTTTYPGFQPTGNGQNNTVAALRCPATAGTHTVSVTMTAGAAHIGFEGLGTPAASPLAATAPPRVYAFGPIHENNDYAATATFLYAKTFENVVAQMATDGYLVEYVNVQDHVTYMGNPDPTSSGATGSSCMANQLHPADCGHAAMAAALQNSIPH